MLGGRYRLTGSLGIQSALIHKNHGFFLYVFLEVREDLEHVIVDLFGDLIVREACKDDITPFFYHVPSIFNTDRVGYVEVFGL